MKNHFSTNRFLLLVLLVLGITSLTSCSSDNDPIPPISIVGEWKIQERTITLDQNTLNQSPGLDNIINASFIEEQQRYTLKQIFNNNSFDFQVINPANGRVVRNNEGSYQIKSDSLFFINTTFNISYSSAFLLGQTKLVMYQPVTKKELAPLLVQMGVMLPETLPNDLKGSMKTVSAR